MHLYMYSTQRGAWIEPALSRSVLCFRSSSRVRGGGAMSCANEKGVSRYKLQEPDRPDEGPGPDCFIFFNRVNFVKRNFSE